MCIFSQEKEIMEENKCDLPCDEHRVGFKYHTLSSYECEIMKFRFEFPVQRLCENHFRDHFTLYSLKKNHQKCCDPCNRHKKVAKSNLCEISLEFAQKTKNFSEHRVIPGQKLCRRCISYLNEVISSNEEIRRQDNVDNSTQPLSDSQESVNSSDQSESLSKLPIITNLEIVNELLEKLNISKIQKKSLNDPQMIERKISEIGDAI